VRVTHEIDQAISIADRLLVLVSRPDYLVGSVRVGVGVSAGRRTRLGGVRRGSEPPSTR
jgi:ABC-type nitrate/sulfonate/bicarbonate transport system ATPase subunit